MPHLSDGKTMINFNRRESDSDRECNCCLSGEEDKETGEWYHCPCCWSGWKS